MFAVFMPHYALQVKFYENLILIRLYTVACADFIIIVEPEMYIVYSVLYMNICIMHIIVLYRYYNYTCMMVIPIYHIWGSSSVSFRNIDALLAAGCVQLFWIPHLLAWTQKKVTVEKYNTGADTRGDTFSTLFYFSAKAIPENIEWMMKDLNLRWMAAFLFHNNVHRSGIHQLTPKTKDWSCSICCW